MIAIATQTAILASLQPQLSEVFTRHGLNAGYIIDHWGQSAEPYLTATFDNGREGPDGIGGRCLQACRITIELTDKATSEHPLFTVTPDDPVGGGDWNGIEMEFDGWKGLSDLEVVDVAQDYATKLAESRDAVVLWLYNLAYENLISAYID